MTGLDNTPATITALLSRFAASDPIWDSRPDPERFRLREIVAHLADWEDVFRERFERTVSEDVPQLVRPDIDARSVERGYATADPEECLNRFRTKRTALTEWLRSLPDETFAREGHLLRFGNIPMDGLIAVMLGHDAYHLRQVAEWLAASN